MESPPKADYLPAMLIADALDGAESTSDQIQILKNANALVVDSHDEDSFELVIFKTTF